MVALQEESKLPHGEPLSTADLLEHLPYLKEVPKGIFEKFAKDAAVLRRFKPGEVVCYEGDFGSTAFYIVSGSVEIRIASPMAHLSKDDKPINLFGGLIARMKNILSSEPITDEDAKERKTFIPIDASVDLDVGKPIATLDKGELFGEMTCRTFAPRSATVVAKEECVMVEMLRVLLDMLTGTREVPDFVKEQTKIKAPTFKGTTFKEELERKYRDRSLENHLRRVPTFSSIDQEFIHYLCENVALKSFHKGSIICQQGDTADAFYLIRQGMVKVVQNMPGGEMVRTYLSRGDFFGEIGLLLDRPRNATCIATDTVDVVEVCAKDFKEMVKKFPKVKESLSAIAEERNITYQFPKVTTSLNVDVALNEGLLQAQNLLLIDLEKCTRCDLCVQSCADAHEGVSRLLRDGLRYDKFLVATACRSCQDPLCMTQCPVGSIRRRTNLEIIIEDWCIGCSKCAELCPYGNINMQKIQAITAEPKPKPKEDEEAKETKPKKPKMTTKATTCDLCMQMNEPSCVYACPHDAAMRVNPRDFFGKTDSALGKRGSEEANSPSVKTHTTH